MQLYFDSLELEIKPQNLILIFKFATIMMEEKTKIDVATVIKDMNRRATETPAFEAVLDANVKSHHANIYRNHQSLWAIKKNMPLTKNDVVVEFGCGTGRLIFQLNNYCKQIIGLDISDKMIDAANKLAKEKKTSNVQFIHSAEKIPLADNSVDKIYVCWVFSLMPDMAIHQALKEFERILKPNGGAYIFDHTSNSGKETGNLQVHRKPEHLQEVLASSNLKIAKNKKVIRHPSRGMSIWTKINNSNFTFILPLLQMLDDQLVLRKPEFIDYYTEFFELKKLS